MSIPTFLSDLVGTLETYLRIATVRLKDASGILQVRDQADSAFAKMDTHTLGLQGSNASYQVSLTAPAGLAADYDIVLPATDGSSGQVLKTNGDGSTEWTGAVSNASLWQEEDFTQATSSPLTIFTPPANAVISRVQVHVTTGASAGSPTISVGVAGTVERDMAAAQCDLLTEALFEVHPNTDVGGTPGAVIATIVTDSQTFEGTVRVEYAVPA